MLKTIVLCAAFSVAGTGLASAQQVIAEYYAMIADQDLVNSRGARLGNLAAYLQQDRANFHRFGRAHPSDQFDPIFTSSDARGTIPSLYAAGGGSAEIETQMARYGSAYVLVRIYGSGGRPSYLRVFQGAG